MLSGVSGEGIDTALRALAKEIVKKRGPKAITKAAKKAWTP